MTGGAWVPARRASALAALRRVRRRLERESARSARFLDLFVRRPHRATARPAVGSSPLPLGGSGEAR